MIETILEILGAIVLFLVINLLCLFYIWYNDHDRHL
jgi:hypothetical protein